MYNFLRCRSPPARLQHFFVGFVRNLLTVFNPLRANYCHTWHMENHPFLWRRIRRVRRIQECMARKGLTCVQVGHSLQLRKVVLCLSPFSGFSADGSCPCVVLGANEEKSSKSCLIWVGLEDLPFLEFWKVTVGKFSISHKSPMRPFKLPLSFFLGVWEKSISSIWQHGNKTSWQGKKAFSSNHHFSRQAAVQALSLSN